jgi:hypothetical protein
MVNQIHGDRFADHLRHAASGSRGQLLQALVLLAL